MAVEVSEVTPVQQVFGSLLENFDCLPVFFIGSGMSRRYIGSPDWDGALREALTAIEDEHPTYEYLRQKHAGDTIAIGSEIADIAFEWAWTKGKNSFDPALFESEDRAIFLKSIIADKLKEITPDTFVPVSEQSVLEVSALKAARPHAIITTNYDELLEKIFVGYESIVGRNVLRYNLNSFGEVYHIHGSVTNPQSMVVTRDDYIKLDQQSRYFAAKLLTYFVEHPVFIFGYSIGDPNIQTVLRDIGEIVADDTGLIANVNQVVWHANAESITSVLSEFSIPAGKKQYRIRVVNVSSFDEVLPLLVARRDLTNVNPAVIRSLAARVYKLTRKDIPSGEVNVDYQVLEHITGSDEALPKLLGLTVVDNTNKQHPYTLRVVAAKLGLKGWNAADRLLKEVRQNKGIDIKASDNIYHCAVKTGEKERSIARKYSQSLVEVLRKVRAGEAYELAIGM